MDSLTIDFSFAKSPLFVRQTLASAFGLALNQEFTWESLTAQIREAARALALKRLLIQGISQVGVALPDEAQALRQLLRNLDSELPSLKVLVTLHD